MSEQNAILALQNACNGVVNATGEMTHMAATVAALPESTPVDSLDLEGYRKVTMAHATAVMALTGLVEELQRKRESGKQA